MPGPLSGGLKIIVTDFAHAAPVFGQAGTELGDLTEAIGQSLAGLGNFWGNDGPGTAFASSYLPSQAAILSRLGSAAGAVSGVGSGLQQMAANYGITEYTNMGIAESLAQAEAGDVSSILSQKVTRPNLPPLPVPSGRPGSPAMPRPDPRPGPSPTPPSPSPHPATTPSPAASPTAHPTPDPQPGPPPSTPIRVGPSGLLGEFLWDLGIPWPQASEGGLREAGDQWTRLGNGIADIMAPANTEAASIAANNSGQAVDAFEHFWTSYGGRGGDLAHLAESCHSVATACYRYADAVTSAKHKIEEAGAEFAAVLVASTIAAYFTFGASEAAADSIGAALLAGARAALSWLQFDEVPAIVADMITTVAQLGTMALSGAFIANAGLAAEDLVKTAFGEDLPPAADQLMEILHGGEAGLVGGGIGAIGGEGATNAARLLTQLGDGIASGEIKVADPAIAGAFLQLADVLGPGGKALSDLTGNAVAQLVVNHEFSMQDMTKDFVSSNIAEAIHEMQESGD